MCNSDIKVIMANLSQWYCDCKKKIVEKKVAIATSYSFTSFNSDFFLPLIDTHLCCSVCKIHLHKSRRIWQLLAHTISASNSSSVRSSMWPPSVMIHSSVIYGGQQKHSYSDQSIRSPRMHCSRSSSQCQS